MERWVKLSQGALNADHVVRWRLRPGGQVAVYLDAPVGNESLALPGASDDPLAQYVLLLEGEDATALLQWAGA